MNKTGNQRSPRGAAFTLLLALGFMCAPVLAAGDDTAAGADAERIAAGQELAFERSRGNCLACHQIADGELPGEIGPALADMKARFPDRDLLYERIWNEQKFNPATVMPPFGPNLILSEDEINQIIDYLYTQ